MDRARMIAIDNNFHHPKLCPKFQGKSHETCISNQCVSLFFFFFYTTQSTRTRVCTIRVYQPDGYMKKRFKKKKKLGERRRGREKIDVRADVSGKNGVSVCLYIGCASSYRHVHINRRKQENSDVRALYSVEYRFNMLLSYDICVFRALLCTNE